MSAATLLEINIADAKAISRRLEHEAEIEAVTTVRAAATAVYIRIWAETLSEEAAAAMRTAFCLGQRLGDVLKLQKASLKPMGEYLRITFLGGEGGSQNRRLQHPCLRHITGSTITAPTEPQQTNISVQRQCSLGNLSDDQGHGRNVGCTVPQTGGLTGDGSGRSESHRAPSLLEACFRSNAPEVFAGWGDFALSRPVDGATSGGGGTDLRRRSGTAVLRNPWEQGEEEFRRKSHSSKTQIEELPLLIKSVQAHTITERLRLARLCCEEHGVPIAAIEKQLQIISKCNEAYNNKSSEVNHGEASCFVTELSRSDVEGLLKGGLIAKIGAAS